MFMPGNGHASVRPLVWGIDLGQSFLVTTLTFSTSEASGSSSVGYVYLVLSVGAGLLEGFTH